MNLGKTKQIAGRQVVQHGVLSTMYSTKCSVNSCFIVVLVLPKG